MRTIRLRIEAVACSSLQTAGQHMSDRSSDQGSLNVVLNGVAIQVTNLVYFFKFAPGMVTSLNTHIDNKTRSTTHFGKGR